MRRIWRALGATTVVALSVTGCAGDSPPTGDELFDQAEQHYRDYRAVTNDVQSLIFDGPWEASVGSFGMQPSGAGCPDDSYKFDLTRITEVESSEQSDLSAAVRGHLEDAGFEVESQELGSGEAASLDVIVRKQGDFSLLMVTFIANGSVLVTATTPCWPGDRNELSDMMFGGVTLGEGYLPRAESPSDPLFFGVTPGEPSWRPSPTPTPTP